MNTKEVCRRLSVTPKMLRVYESQKLICARRSENDYRDYSLDDALQIQIIVMLRNLGFSLKEIKKVLDFKKSQKDYLNHFYIQLKAVETKVNELNVIKDKLNGVINDILNGSDIDEKLLHRNETASDGETTTYENMLNRWNFDLMAVDYVNRYLKEDTGYLNAINRSMELLENMVSDRTVLDLGGGTCNLWLNSPSDTQLTVIDKSLQMIFAAKENIPWANFMLDDFLSLDKKRLGRFDVVVSTFTLHHISYDQQEKAIKSMIDLCRDGGKILIVDRSFHNQAEKDIKEKELADAGNMEFLEIIRSEFYLLSDHVTNYIRYMGLQADTLFFEEEIWGFLIENNAEQSI